MDLGVIINLTWIIGETIRHLFTDWDTFYRVVLYGVTHPIEYSCLLASFLPIIVATTNPPTTTTTPTADITAIAHTGNPSSV